MNHGSRLLFWCFWLILLQDVQSYDGLDLQLKESLHLLQKDPPEAFLLRKNSCVSCTCGNGKRKKKANVIMMEFEVGCGLYYTDETMRSGEVKSLFKRNFKALFK